MTNPLTRIDLAALATRYFHFVDTGDIANAASLFAPDAVFTVQSDHTTLTGREEIRSMLASFSERSKTMAHHNRNIVVDEVARKVSTEQQYIGEFYDGTRMLRAKPTVLMTSYHTRDSVEEEKNRCPIGQSFIYKSTFCGAQPVTEKGHDDL